MYAKFFIHKLITDDDYEAWLVDFYDLGLMERGGSLWAP